MSNDSTKSDGDVRRLLDTDASEPAAEIDEEIRSAAREALASEGGRREPAARKPWRIPAAFGAAAAVVLAVMIVDQAPQPTPEIMSDVVEESAPVSTPASRAPPLSVPETPMKSQRSVEQTASFGAAGPTQEHDCSEPGNALSAGGLRVCVMEEHLDVHDSDAGDCGDTLRLQRESGTTSLGRIQDGIEIFVDGESAWQVRCVEGVWALDER